MTDTITTTICLNKEHISKIDLTLYGEYLDWCENYTYFNLNAGEDHYKLIHYISSFIDTNPVIDIGTFYGFSATALSVYNKHKVVTYDIVDCIPDSAIKLKNHNNIEFNIMNCLNDIERICSSDFIVLDIDPHDGKEERVIIQELIDNNFKGILLLDDIYINDYMKDFWEEITLDKIDVTKYGHFIGTGIVLFSNKFNFILE